MCLAAKNRSAQIRAHARICSEGEDDDDFRRNFSFGEENDHIFCIDFDRPRRSGVVAFVDGGGPAPRVLSPPFVLDNRSSSSSSSSSLFAFQLAPRGGYLTIENNLGWSYELQSQLSYFLTSSRSRRARKSRFPCKTRRTERTFFLSTTEDVKNTSNFCFFLRRIRCERRAKSWLVLTRYRLRTRAGLGATSRCEA